MVRITLALGAALALQACIAAAALPIAAGATIGRKVARKAPSAAAAAAAPAPSGLTMLPPGSTLPPPTPRSLPGPPAVPATMQYLYGSGEAAALSIQTWRALVRHVADKMLQRPKDSVVLAINATLAKPQWESCGTKPPAVVLDVDETTVLTIGRQYHNSTGVPLSAAQQAEWEVGSSGQVVAVPGAVRAVEALRTMNVTVIFVTDRGEAHAAATAKMLADVGLGATVPGETLFSAGEGPFGSRKDPRRAAIGSLHCVLAMAGDQLGDFSDLFDAAQGAAARRAETLSTPVNARFGAGWFLLPNPVYGTGVQGGVDDVFPQDMRWSPTP